MFRCNFCPNSANYINCYKEVRLKSIRKCIEELKTIRDTHWLRVKHVFINDMLFLPKKSNRNEFFNEMRKLIDNEGSFPFQIEIEDRVDLYKDVDLENYKSIQIIPQFGLESASRKLLYRIGKVLGNTPDTILKGIDRYLQKTKELIIKSNEIDYPISLFYVIGLPGTDMNTIRESHDFFFKKGSDGNDLISTYKINLRFAIYHAYKGSFFYDNAQDLYGTKMFFEMWWKIFDKDQYLYSQLVDPSHNLTLPVLINEYRHFLKKIFKSQKELNNGFYSGFKYLTYIKHMDDVVSLYRKNVHNF